MVESLTPEELDAQIELRKQRFGQVIADMRKVLQEDLRGFVQREAKRAFLRHPAASESMGKDRVASLKQRSGALADEVSARVASELADESLWLSSDATPDNTRELSGAHAVWAKVLEVEAALKGLLAEFGLDAEPPPPYKAPAYFVKGLYMPSLAEHFWRLVHELKELEEHKVQIRDDAVREHLESKWDDA